MTASLPEDHLTELAKQNGINTTFPNPTEYRPDGQVVNWSTPGITKRELFAAMAMQGCIASSGIPGNGCGRTAKYAVEYADELLKELAK